MNLLVLSLTLLIGVFIGFVVNSTFGKGIVAKIKEDADKSKDELKSTISAEATKVKSSIGFTEATLKAHVTNAIEKIPNLNTPSKLPG